MNKNHKISEPCDDILHFYCLTEDATTFYRSALLIASKHFSTYGENDEIQIVERIKKSLIKDHREKDSILFTQLHRRLLSSTILKNRWAILCLLLSLKDGNKSENVKIDGISRGITNVPLEEWKLDLGNRNFRQSSNDKKNESAVNPVLDSTHSLPGNAMPGSKSAVGSRVATLLSYWQTSPSNEDQKLQAKPSYEFNGNKKEIIENLTNEVPESVLLREIVFTLQGIEGKIIRFDSGKESIWIDPKAGIAKPTRKMLLKLGELGWLYNKIRRYCDTRADDKSLGLVGQSFIAALKQELNEYYRLLTVFETQFQQEEEHGISSGFGGLTLRRLMVWTVEPLARLKILAALVDICKGLKGGALASAVHSYLKHGDPYVRSLVKNILALVSMPLYSKLHRWIIDGELDDSFNEFFVAADPNVNENKLWHEKYSLRKSMVPSFLSMKQARKILSTGKSINFLRQVCLDRTPLHGREAIRSTLENTNVESLFTQDHDGDLQRMIDVAYKETGLHVLNVMHSTYKFMDHLKAMRRYLLLGQGDFIRHLMDLLESHLNKPAASLYLHSLSGILDTAIRSTNAQFDDPDILKRLDIKLLEMSAGDNGWDVFTLYYHMDGPIGTVFTPKVLLIYLRLFNSLWRAKRMEYVLSGMWKAQMANSRMLTPLSELGPILHQCHVLTSEMVHFVQQMQYYITFEVMECSWDVLEKKVKSAEDLDQVIAAHEEFLDTIMTRALLDDCSMDILNQLRTIYDLIIQFQNIQDEFSELALNELRLRQIAEGVIVQEEKLGHNGMAKAKSDAEIQRQREFSKSASLIKTKLRILSITYQDMVKKFLIMLTSHTDVSLQFLSFRLDFNEHYKNRDSRLQTPLTYQHRRMAKINR